MKIVVLDGYTLNPGDISWGGMEALGEVTVYDRTKMCIRDRPRIQAEHIMEQIPEYFLFCLDPS